MRILVLGIGNVMFSDEGVGVHLCHLLEEKYFFKCKNHSVDFVDGGTLAQRLIPIIVEYDYVIILDCVDANDGEIGDVYFFDFENVPNSISWQGSAHEVEMLQTLTMIDLLGDRPTIKIIGIVPEVVEDENLKQLNDIAPLGVLTVPVKRGQQVKGFYLKRIAEAIKHIQGEAEKQ